MEPSYRHNYASSIRFIRDLRRLMPTGRHGHRHKSRPPDPVPSPSLEALEHSVDCATTAPCMRRPVSRMRALEAIARGEDVSRSALTHNIVPSHVHHRVDLYDNSVYDARFIGEAGDRFVSSCRDKRIRIYDTGMSECEDAWKMTDTIRAIGVRWTITDFEVSPCGRWLAYSSMNRFVHLVDLHDKKRPQIALDFAFHQTERVDVWSLIWSSDSRQLIAGTSEGRHKGDGEVVVYDLETRRFSNIIEAHDGDVNTVCHLHDGDENLILSGADDGLVKLWDKRQPFGVRDGRLHRPCSVFVGHQFGITFISSKGDGRFFLSNGKDQYIKLWDTRKCMSQSELRHARLPPRDLTFDYRIQAFPTLTAASGNFKDDSIMTYGGGHETLQTLIRARFSPRHTTGQRYIYCGSSDGRCTIYDVLTGKEVRSLRAHEAPVRDVSWHPYGCFLTTSSWDGQVLLWSTDSNRKFEMFEGRPGLWIGDD